MGKLEKAMKRALRGQRGITGLETAIILIAFVIVASVFAFVTLSTGLFSAERSKETVFAGLQKAQSNLELHGSLVITGATGGAGDATGGTLTFQLALAAGGNPISFDAAADNNRVVINYVDSDSRVADLNWTAVWIVRSDSDELLEPGELVQIEIALPVTSQVNADTGVPAVNERFTLEVVAPSGGSMLIARTMPPAIDPVMDLH